MCLCVGRIVRIVSLEKGKCQTDQGAPDCWELIETSSEDACFIKAFLFSMSNLPHEACLIHIQIQR